METGITPMNKNYAEIAAAHRQGIDLSYSAPDLPESVRRLLPAPVLDSHPEWLELYWRTWSIAFDQVREPAAESGLSTYCDAAFSHNLFQWDTCFMECFLRYAVEPFYAYGSLDNFYRKQHSDGYICREINSITGADFWERAHPSSINPPLFADAEWLLYNITNDSQRLTTVLEPLCRYHTWLKNHRRSRDGVGYWTTALASGMDNSPRALEKGGEGVHKSYGYVWLCITAQQALAARRLSQIAEVAGKSNLARHFSEEFDLMASYVFDTFWNEALGCYSDVAADGSPSSTMTPAMCWPLLLAGRPVKHAKRIADALSNESLFWRRHAIPSLSANHVKYHSHGHYWCGSVWPPLVYLAARAMAACGFHELATAISTNHLENLTAVYAKTGTFWENYAPDSAEPGDVSRPEFVGWTGCGPIALLIESIIGIAISAPRQLVTWRMTRKDRHGIRNLPFADKRLTLIFEPERNELYISAPIAFDLLLIRNGKEDRFSLSAGDQKVQLQ